MEGTKQSTLNNRTGLFTVAVRGTEFEKLQAIKVKTGKSYADIIADIMAEAGSCGGACKCH